MEKTINRILGIIIPYLIINLLLCHGFFKNINSFFVFKYPKSMLEYYFSEGFSILECNTNNLEKLPNEVKQRTHAEETDKSDYVITCINKIPSKSNTLEDFLLNKSSHYSYIQTEFNEKGEIINNIFSSYVEPFLKDINHPAFLQEWKLNIDATVY